MNGKLINGGIYTLNLKPNRYWIVLGRTNKVMAMFDAYSYLAKTINNQSELVDELSKELKIMPVSDGKIFDKEEEVILNLVDGYLGQVPDELFDKLKTIGRKRYTWL